MPALSHHPTGGVIFAIPSESLSSSQCRGGRGRTLRLRLGGGGVVGWGKMRPCIVLDAEFVLEGLMVMERVWDRVVISLGGGLGLGGIGGWDWGGGG